MAYRATIVLKLVCETCGKTSTFLGRDEAEARNKARYVGWTVPVGNWDTPPAHVQWRVQCYNCWFKN